MRNFCQISEMTAVSGKALSIFFAVAYSGTNSPVRYAIRSSIPARREKFPMEFPKSCSRNAQGRGAISADNPICEAGNVVVMGNHHYGLPKLCAGALDKPQPLGPGLAVKVAGRLGCR